MINAPIYLVFIPIISSLVIYTFKKNYVNYLSFVAQGIITIVAFFYYLYIKEKGTQYIYFGGWDRAIGIAFKIDKLSISFILLTVIIWWVVIIYSWHKVKKDYKFLFFLLFLEGSFLGFLQTNDLFNMFVLIEVITIISAILIIYKKDGYSVRAGFYYLLFNSAGMIFYLIGLAFLYYVSGTLNMDTVKQVISPFKDRVVIKASYIFIISALGAKSAFFPVYNWLPKAHGAAPSSISALLSGLLVKSGLYGFIRINEMFDILLLEDFFLNLGFITALLGVIFALSQKDIKQILAFHTISQIGIILIGIASLKGNMFYGGLLHLFNHAFFKSLLFLGAGFIINEYNIRRVTEIRGGFKTFPFLTILMFIGMFSITGAPLFSGYVSKSIIKYGVKENIIFTFMFNIINMGTIISFIKFSQIFRGEKISEKKERINVNLSMFILAILCILFGVFSPLIIKLLWDIELQQVKFFKIESWITYLLQIGIGWLVYKYIIEKDYWFLKKMRHLIISFETSMIMMVVFICVMVIFVQSIN